MKTVEGKFTFKVPEGHPQAGTKIERKFTFPECETEPEAVQTINEKAAKSEKAAESWSVLALVNELLKKNARANAYQAALAPYLPSDVPAEDQREKAIRDLIRAGLSEEHARAVVTSAFATQEAAQAENPAEGTVTVDEPVAE